MKDSSHKVSISPFADITFTNVYPDVNPSGVEEQVIETLAWIGIFKENCDQ